MSAVMTAGMVMTKSNVGKAAMKGMPGSIRIAPAAITTTGLGIGTMIASNATPIITPKAPWLLMVSIIHVVSSANTNYPP